LPMLIRVCVCACVSISPMHAARVFPSAGCRLKSPHILQYTKPNVRHYRRYVRLPHLTPPLPILPVRPSSPRVSLRRHGLRQECHSINPPLKAYGHNIDC
jgi:hypothetical protein